MSFPFASYPSEVKRSAGSRGTSALPIFQARCSLSGHHLQSTKLSLLLLETPLSAQHRGAVRPTARVALSNVGSPDTIFVLLNHQDTQRLQHFLTPHLPPSHRALDQGAGARRWGASPLFSPSQGSAAPLSSHATPSPLLYFCEKFGKSHQDRKAHVMTPWLEGGKL